jgi:hypothetical protein
MSAATMATTGTARSRAMSLSRSTTTEACSCSPPGRPGTGTFWR